MGCDTQCSQASCSRRTQDRLALLARLGWVEQALAGRAPVIHHRPRRRRFQPRLERVPCTSGEVSGVNVRRSIVVRHAVSSGADRLVQYVSATSRIVPMVAKGRTVFKDTALVITFHWKSKPRKTVELSLGQIHVPDLVRISAPIRLSHALTARPVSDRTRTRLERWRGLKTRDVAIIGALFRVLYFTMGILHALRFPREPSLYILRNILDAYNSEPARKELVSRALADPLHSRQRFDGCGLAGYTIAILSADATGKQVRVLALLAVHAATVRSPFHLRHMPGVWTGVHQPRGLAISSEMCAPSAAQATPSSSPSARAAATGAS